ncbi:MAG: DUF58 domain-containing protein [Magnetococcales bacterium]|nr:DUF58 domain-containing protein [Magnetococcales bacterium]
MWRWPEPAAPAAAPAPASGTAIRLAELLTLRHQAARLVLPGHRRTTSPLAGPFRSAFRGRGMEFEEVREYQPGDDIRNMDWRVTARTGRPHTKLFREERERPVYLLVDLNPAMAFGTRVSFKSVAAARAAALLGWAAVRSGDRVGGLVLAAGGHQEIRPGRGHRGLLPLLRTLESLQPHPGAAAPPTPLADGLDRLRRVARPGSLILIVSDFTTFDQQARRHLALLAAHNGLLPLLIHDPLEADPPPAGRRAYSDGHRTLTLDLGQGPLATAYRAAFARRRDELTVFCHGRGVLPLLLSTAEDPLTVLANALAPGHASGRGP